MFLKSIEIRGFKSFADKTELVFCYKCGGALEGGSKFCTKCGAKVIHQPKE